MLTRRDLLARTALAGAAVLAPRLARAADRPDIVFVLVDDLASRVLGAYGGKAVPTPRIDRLAAEGAVFDRCYVSLSLCSPSRATILTGRYAHDTGVADNEGSHLADEGDTYAGWLQQAGYRTAYVGKWHQGDQDAPRPGFDRWVSFRGQGRYEDPTFDIDGKIAVQRGYVTDLLTDRAIEFLAEPSRAPRLLVLAHKATHAPFEPPQRYTDAPVDWPIPKIAPGDLDGKPEWVRKRASHVDNGEIEHDAAGYLRCLRAVDDSVGRLYDALAEARRLDDTVIVLSSDNGFFLGEHGLMDKRAMYDESALLPLIVRYPPVVKAGTRVSELVSNLDFAPTLAEAGGAAVPATVAGRSLWPLLRGETKGWRTALLYEYFQEREIVNTPDLLGVFTPRWTYILTPSESFEELYDREADPRQEKNLARDKKSAKTLQKLRAQLDELKTQTGYRRPPGPPEPGPPMRTDDFVLQYVFDEDGDVVRDRSKRALDGLAKGAPIAEVAGRKARRFDGSAVVEGPDTEALDPSRGPWTIEARVYAEGDDGVIVAQTSEAHGWVLGVRDGKPLAVWKTKERADVVGEERITGRWAHLCAVVTAEKRLQLWVDGKRVGESDSVAFLAKQPGKGLTIGRDGGEALTKLPGFTGAIASVSIYSGARAPAAIADDARGP